MYYPSISPYHYQIQYCTLVIALNDCKWYQFSKKNEIKELMDWMYPFMVMENKLLNPAPSGGERRE